MKEKVILVAGSLSPAISYEYVNFLLPMKKMGWSVVPFEFISRMGALGQRGMNQELLDVVKREKPGLVFFVPHSDQFISDVVDRIGQHAVTLGYFYDDTWRIEYSRKWARHFHFITTSDINGVRKFKDSGFSNVIYSPFACNTDIYCKQNIPKLYDVTFVGRYHPYREWLIDHIRKSGIDVNVWGTGWSSGMVNFKELIKIINQSRINLNMSNCVSWDIRYLLKISRPIGTTMRVWRQATKALKRSEMKTAEMVKGRVFEISACGGFQLSHFSEGLERMYVIGEEIALYDSLEDMTEKIHYYLSHEEERETIALRARERSLCDHKVEMRLKEIWERSRNRL